MTRLGILILKLALILVMVPAMESTGGIGATDAGDASLASSAHDFDYLLGDWHGHETGSRLTVERTANLHVLQETRAGLRTTSVALRSFDEATGRWYLTTIDSDGEPRVWEGRKRDGVWRFTRRAAGPEGVQQRLSWTTVESGGFSTLLEESADGGATWREAARERFVRRCQGHKEI